MVPCLFWGRVSMVSCLFWGWVCPGWWVGIHPPTGPGTLLLGTGTGTWDTVEKRQYTIYLPEYFL